MKTQFKTKVKVGLDIGASAIKMVEVTEVSGAKPSVTAVGFKRIISNSRESIAALIKTVSEEAKISSKEVVISVSGPSVIVRFISMPKMDDEALRGAIKFEAEKFIPFNINDCIIDFQVLRKNEKDGRLSVILVAAKKEHVQDKIKLAEEAGLSVVTVDVDNFALANAFLTSMTTVDPENTIALLNIGAALTNLIILRGSSIYFTRDVAIGGNELTNSIAKKMACDIKAAENMKISPPKDKEQEIRECVKSVLNSLLDDVKLSFSYHENQSGRGIDHIYISGGSADVIGLNEAFKDVFECDPSFWNPFQFATLKTVGLDTAQIEKMKNSFSIACGLAIR